MNRDIRFLIVAFDGLRPDMVDADLMPNLSTFRRQGANCTDNRAVFPTETRVNQSSLVTGCHPARHGMVANKFMEPASGGAGSLYGRCGAAKGSGGGYIMVFRP